MKMKITLLLASLLLTTSLLAQGTLETKQLEIQHKTELLEKDLDLYKESLRDDDLEKQKMYESKINRDYNEIMKLRKELKEFS
ncbi:MAG: hypothetical protein U9O86_10885 [Campylobacterota bacterium]|nr:hypothetical protein [Campylobacterota bacterium]